MNLIRFLRFKFDKKYQNRVYYSYEIIRFYRIIKEVQNAMLTKVLSALQKKGRRSKRRRREFPDSDSFLGMSDKAGNKVKAFYTRV